MDWSKALALQNIPSIVVTFDTFQSPMDWSKALARQNIRFIVVTFDTFQLLISSLKSDLFINNSVIFVTFSVFQVEIWPRVVISLDLYHVFTCLLIFKSLRCIVGFLCVYPLFMNIYLISITFETSQLPIDWLKDRSLENIDSIMLTFETSQLPIGWLKALAP